MTAILPRFARPRLPRTAVGALFGVVMAAGAVLLFRGFTVDDALISTRVAHHIATGHGYRFNAPGPIVDAVTPLGWAYLLVPFAQGDPWSTLQGARTLGVIAWLVSAAWLGMTVAHRRAALWPLGLLLVSCPVGLWASAGMETAVITALVTFAATACVGWRGCLGVAAAWRPELVPFAFVLAVGRTQSIGRAWRDLAVTLGPSIAVSLIRWWCFGYPAPLSLMAKPSDLTHGFWYSVEALLWSGPMWLWLTRAEDLSGSESPQPSAGGTWRVLRRAMDYVPRLPPLERREGALALAIVAHFLAIVVAGGDWMPGYRLVVPVVPSMLLVACHVPKRGRLLTALAASLAMAASLTIACRLAPTARHVVEQRRRLIDEAVGVLAPAHVVAAPDVGWVGAAFSGTVLDLAGATDESVAHLPGGHTSKRIEAQLFRSRRVDYVIVLLAPPSKLETPWTESRFARVIDYRAAMRAAELDCRPLKLLELAHTTQRYLVLSCPRS